jgi:DNA-binding CsgD family transcriptional regulator
MGLACVHAARDEIGPALAEAEACHRIAAGVGHDEWGIGGRFVRAVALLRIFAAVEARELLRALLPDAERTGSAWWSCNARAYLALACIQCHDVAEATDVLERRAPQQGCAAERRLEWARAELALLRRDGPSAHAIVDGLLEAHPAGADAAIPALLLVRGAALILERRHGSAVQALERARDAALASGGLGLSLRIHAALASALTLQGRPDRAAGRVALRRREAGRFSGLTWREREIAALVGKGATNGEIAKRLHLSPRTVETHVENILVKLRAKSRVQIAVWAANHLA